MEEKECWLIHPASAHLVVGHFSTVPHYISTTVYFVKNGIILTCIYICFQMLLLVTRDFSALSSESWTPVAFYPFLLQSCFRYSVLCVCFLHIALSHLPFPPVLDLPVLREIQQFIKACFKQCESSTRVCFMFELPQTELVYIHLPS